MEPQPELLPLYLELAEAYSRQGEVVLRDYFVLLAAEAYLASGQEDEGEHLYAEFVGRNPDHVLVLAGSLAAAVNDPQGGEYFTRLRQNYPEDVVRDLVQEARVRRPQRARSPEAARPLPPTQPVPILRQNNPPPGRGPGNPVPAPRPQPTLPPRREPTPAPVRPQPIPTRPVPMTPGGPPRRHLDPGPAVPADGDVAGLPVVNFALFLVLVAGGVFLAAWTLLRPLLP